MVKVAPSILSGNFLNLEPDIRMVNDNADLIHIDVMDGSLVPNISFGFPVMEAIAKVVTVPMDVHLMIVNPDKYIERFAKCGASLISFHLEATDQAGKNPSDIIALIKSCGAKAGLAINPDVPSLTSRKWISSWSCQSSPDSADRNSSRNQSTESKPSEPKWKDAGLSRT